MKTIEERGQIAGQAYQFCKDKIEAFRKAMGGGHEMTLSEAIKICKEMQKWRRAEPPYDFVTPNLMPYTAKEYGEALDKLIEYAEEDEK